MKFKEREPVHEVYVILRVFNLDKDNIDMRVFVDPEGMRERKQLVFTAESYSVIPGSGAGS
jgi:hypothetical protein